MPSRGMNLFSSKRVETQEILYLECQSGLPENPKSPHTLRLMLMEATVSHQF